MISPTLSIFSLWLSLKGCQCIHQLGFRQRLREYLVDSWWNELSDVFRQHIASHSWWYIYAAVNALWREWVINRWNEAVPTYNGTEILQVLPHKSHGIGTVNSQLNVKHTLITTPIQSNNHNWHNRLYLIATWLTTELKIWLQTLIRLRIQFHSPFPVVWSSISNCNSDLNWVTHHCVIHQDEVEGLSQL